MASLQGLARENGDEYWRVWQYLGSFLRYPPKLESYEEYRVSSEYQKPENKEAIEKQTIKRMGNRPDVAKIARLLRRETEHKQRPKSFRLPLSSAELAGADLRRAQLQRANLSEADLQHAELSEAQLQYANLCGAVVKGTKFKEADLEGCLWGRTAKRMPQEQDLTECKNLSQD